MNAKELFETTMDPSSRKLLQGGSQRRQRHQKPTKMFTILMGDVVEPRRQFIEDNALA